MWAYPGKALLLVAFFTTTGFSCYKSRTYFDTFTITCASCDEYPGGYYQFLLDNGNTTSVRMECNSKRKFNIQHFSEFGLIVYLERNNRCRVNDRPLGLSEDDQIIEDIVVEEPPLMDLLEVKIKASTPTIYDFSYGQDQCTSTYFSQSAENARLQKTISRDTTLIFAVVPDKLMEFKVKQRGQTVYDEILDFKRSRITIEL